MILLFQVLEKTNTPDIDYYLYYDSKPAEEEAEKNFRIAIDTLNNNPELLDATILKQLYTAYSSYYLFLNGNPLSKIILTSLKNYPNDFVI